MGCDLHKKDDLKMKKTENEIFDRGGYFYTEDIVNHTYDAEKACDLLEKIQKYVNKYIAMVVPGGGDEYSVHDKLCGWYHACYMKGTKASLWCDLENEIRWAADDMRKETIQAAKELQNKGVRNAHVDKLYEEIYKIENNEE